MNSGVFLVQKKETPGSPKKEVQGVRTFPRRISKLRGWRGSVKNVQKKDHHESKREGGELWSELRRWWIPCGDALCTLVETLRIQPWHLTENLVKTGSDRR